MELKFELTVDDYVEFNIYHVMHSKKYKGNMFTQRYLLPIIFLVMPILLNFWVKTPYSRILPLGIGAYILWAIFYKTLYKSKIKRNIKRHIEGEEKKGKAIVGEYDLEILNNAIILKNKGGQLKIRWVDILKIGQDKDRIYVYVDTEMAYIIPKRAFTEKQLEDFLGKLKVKVE